MARCKEYHVLLEALNSIWVGIHGPMRELIMDGEAGLAAAGSAKQYYDQHDIMFVPPKNSRWHTLTDEERC